MVETILISALVAAGVGAATAPYVAAAIMLAVGLGISLISQALFSPSQPKPSDGQVLIRQATAPRFRSYGRVKVGGVLMFMNSKAGILHRVIAMGSGPIDAIEEHWIDDNQVILDSGGNVLSLPYATKARIEVSDGSAAGYRFLLLESVFPDLWTPAHLGRGIPAAYMLMHQVNADQMSEVWPAGGNTNYRQVQRGVRVPGIEGGGSSAVLTAPTWSDNAARVILDFLTHPDGFGLSTSWIQAAIADWDAAVICCDEVIPAEGGGVEARWRIWNTYRFDERPADVLTRLCQACDAIVYPTPGQGLGIKVGQWIAPTVTIDDSCIIAFSEVKRGADVMSAANLIRARFTDPGGDYLEADAQPWLDEADIAARGEFAADFDFFAAPSHSQCRRLMKIAAHRLAPAWSGTFSCNLRAMNVLGERFCIINCAELGIAGETVEIIDIRMTVEQTILTGLQIQWRSLTAEAYEWDVAAAREAGAMPRSAPPVIVPDTTLPLPTGLDVELSGARAIVTWDTPPQDFLAVDVRWKPTAGTEWLLAPVAPGATATVVDGLQSGTEYTFQIRHRSTPTGRGTDWEAVSATAIPDYDDDGSSLRRIEA